MLRWNSDKHYLAALAADGIACVPCQFVEPDSPESLAAVARRRGWSDLVVKPVVGASAFGARRFAGDGIGGAGERHLQALLKRGAALVQPYLDAVETVRERSLVFVEGRLVHAFTKSAFAGLASAATIMPHEPTHAERTLAEAALAAAPEQDLLYARVDLVPGDAGPLLMELELVEPDLGLRLSPAALARLAEACAVRAGALLDL